MMSAKRLTAGHSAAAFIFKIMAENVCGGECRLCMSMVQTVLHPPKRNDRKLVLKTKSTGKLPYFGWILEDWAAVFEV